MKISISNIAWEKDMDIQIYRFLKEKKIDGIEIAPTRVFPDKPYSKINEAKEFHKKMKDEYNLQIASIQSIWYGRKEKIFENERERTILLDYTKQAFEFAHALDCKNLVFGCPKNRTINSEKDFEIAIDFFEKLGKAAIAADTVLALEANPPIYQTNFINTTKAAYEIVKKVDSKGIKINYDIGTVIANGESMFFLKEIISYVNHIHISEPFLAEIKYRNIHETLFDILRNCDYTKFISIEMSNLQSIESVYHVIDQLLALLRRKSNEV